MRVLRIEDARSPGEHHHIAVTVVPAGETTYEHAHRFFEMFLVEDGHGSHVCNGAALPLERGSLAWVRPEDRHFFATSTSHLRFINLSLRAGWWAKMQATLLAAAASRAHFGQGGQVLLADGDFEDCLKAFRTVSNEPQGRPLALTRAVATILDHYVAARSAGTARQRPPAWLAAWLRDLQDEASLAKPLSFWQARSGVSAEHFARSCRAHLGRTPTELLNAARIQWVQRQLLERRETVINLALDAGYNNLGYFYRCFRKAAGATPNQWFREQCERSVVPRGDHRLGRYRSSVPDVRQS